MVLHVSDVSLPAAQPEGREAAPWPLLVYWPSLVPLPSSQHQRVHQVPASEASEAAVLLASAQQSRCHLTRKSESVGRGLLDSASTQLLRLQLWSSKILLGCNLVVDAPLNWLHLWHHVHGDSWFDLSVLLDLVVRRSGSCP